MSWAFVTFPTAAPNQRRELSTASGLSVTWRLNGPASATFTVDGRSDEAAVVVPEASDLLVYRDGVEVFRGRIIAPQDQVGADEHVSSWQAVDYRGWLNNRHIGLTPPTFVNVDQHAIAWQLINHTQVKVNGDLGITDGSTASGTLRERTDYQPGKPIGEAIQELGEVIGGFEWWIGPDLVFHAETPERGQTVNVSLDYGGRLDSLQTSEPVSEHGNAVIGRADANTTNPVLAESATIATDPRGRIERQHSAATTQTQASLVESTNGALERLERPGGRYEARLTLGTWGAPDFWIGDTVELAVRSGRLDIAEPVRVHEIVASIDDSDIEHVTVRLETPKL